MIQTRKITFVRETINSDAFGEPCGPVTRVAAMAVFRNPLAGRFEADLYLPAGEISDSLMYRMANDCVADGRPMVVLVLADCDPAGHQMAVSIGPGL